MKVQYGDACLSLQQVYEWTRKFMNGISSVTDCPRPGQAHPVVTPEDIAAVEAIVKENLRVTVNKIAAHLDMSHGSVHHIVHDVLQFIYVFIRIYIFKYIYIFKIFHFTHPHITCKLHLLINVNIKTGVNTSDVLNVKLITP